MASCRFCSCAGGGCNQHQPVVSFQTQPVTTADSPVRSSSADRFYADGVADGTFCCNNAAIRGTMHKPSRVYTSAGDRLGRQMSGGGGTTEDSVTFPRGDAFIAVDRRRPSPNAHDVEFRGFVPNNIVRNTSHRRFVQSLRSPTSYACAPHQGAGGPGAMLREFPGPRVPEDLRRREAELQLASAIRRNNTPATRSAATRARMAVRSAAGPVAQRKMRPQSAASAAPETGRRRYDPPSSGIAAEVAASAPLAPAARDLAAADELQLRRGTGYFYSSSSGEDGYGIADGELPLFHAGRVASATGLCPPVDGKKRAPFRIGGGGCGGGASFAPAATVVASSAAAGSSSLSTTSPSSPGAAAVGLPKARTSTSAIVEKRIKNAAAEIPLSPQQQRPSKQQKEQPRRPGVGALSTSTIKPTRLAFDPAEDEFVEAGPDTATTFAAAANGVPLRKLYALDRHQSYGARGGYNNNNSKNSAVNTRSGSAPAPVRSTPIAVGAAAAAATSSPSRGARLNRGGGGHHSAVGGQPNISSAADVAAWRRRYYPDAGAANGGARRGFYTDPAVATGGRAGAPPPVCDRCCCQCCCTPGCDYARHRPSACSECLWWYN